MKKQFRRVFSLFLCLMLCLSLLPTAAWADDTAAEPTETILPSAPAEDETPNPEAEAPEPEEPETNPDEESPAPETDGEGTLPDQASAPLPAAGGANDPPIGGIDGSLTDTMSWNLDLQNNTLTISGTGAMPDFADNASQGELPPWNDYKSSIQVIYLDNGVSEIGEYAFAGCTNLHSVEFTTASSAYRLLSSIRQYAFYGCSSLNSIDLPGNVNLSIGNGAFAYCGFDQVTLPGDVLLGNMAFAYNNSLETVTLCGSIRDSQALVWAFHSCPNFTSYVVSPETTLKAIDGLLYNTDGNGGSQTLVAIPTGRQTAVLAAGTVTVAPWAAAFCESLAWVEVPYGVTYIGENAFRYCRDLWSIALPGSLNSVSEYAFEECDSLDQVIFQDEDGEDLGAEDWATVNIAQGNDPLKRAWALTNAPSSGTCGYGVNWEFDCDTGTLRVYMAGGEEMYDFTGDQQPGWQPWAQSIYSVELDSIRKVGAYAFYDLTALEDVSYVNGTPDEIGDSAFQNTGLRSLYIPESVGSIGSYIADAWDGVVLRVHADSEGLYYAWENGYNYIIVDGPEPLGAMYCGPSATWVFDPDTGTLTVSGSGPLWSFPHKLVSQIDGISTAPWGYEINEQIRHVVIGEGITSIGMETFWTNFGRIESVQLPSTLESIGKGAFYNSYSLSSLNLPAGLLWIEAAAFAHCPNLTSLTFPDSLVDIGGTAFQGSGLSSVALPASVTSIEYEAFAGSESLVSVSLPNQLVLYDDEWYEGTFKGCTALSQVDLGTGLSCLTGSMFEGCESLTQLSIPASVKTIGAKALYGTGLTELVLPSGVESLGALAFGGCHHLSRVEVPRSVVEIEGSNAATYYDPTPFDENKLLVVYCYENSYCHEFCEQNDVPYELLEEGPVIFYQPSDVTAGLNQTVSFTVGATAREGELRYRWQYKTPTGSWKNSPAQGADTQTLSVPGTVSRNGYSYRCKVTDDTGTTISEPAVLTVTQAPVIEWHPEDFYGNAGDTATFRVVAYGANLSYQWQYRTGPNEAWHDSPASGNKTDTLTVPATTSRNGYEYRCVVSNSYGSEESWPGMLVLGVGVPVNSNNFPDPIFRAYVEEYFDDDHDGFLSDAERNAAIEIEYFDENLFSIQGVEFFPNLERLNMSESPEWNSCRISQADLSANTKLRYVGLGFSQISQLDLSMLPDLEELFLGFTGLESLDLSGNPKLRSLIISDSNISSLDLSHNPLLAYLDCCGNMNLQTLDLSGCPTLIAAYKAGGRQISWMQDVIPETYARVRVYGGSTDDDYILAVDNFVTVVTGVKPSVTVQPQSVTAAEGETAIFTVEAVGTDLSYQWQYKTPTGSWKNATATGNKTDTLTVPATMSRSGYQYRCKVSNSLGQDLSQPALLTVASAPVITVQPQSVTALESSTAVFTVAAVGSDLSYQWQYKTPTGSWKNATAEGNKTDTLTVPVTMSRNGYSYRCIVSNNVGQDISEPAVLTVSAPPVITVQPQSVTANLDEIVTFSVTATGADLQYQWQYETPTGSTWKNATATGNKTDTLTVPATESRNGYSYRCKVTNAAGEDISAPATLTVTSGPVITAQPQNLTVALGETASFNVTATGSDLSYLWYYKTPTATKFVKTTSASGKTAVYSVTTQAKHNGYQYYCVVTDANGQTATSNTVTLTVH